MRTLTLVILLGWLPFAGYGQQPDKQAKAKAKATEVRPPDDTARRAIEEKTIRLTASVNSLKARGTAEDVLAEVEIYAKAAEWVTRHNEFFGNTASWTAAVLDDGLKRADQAAPGVVAPWWKAAGTSCVRAYRSRVDGSVQPYAITAPAAYGQDPSQTWRLDVVLHGRDATLTEVKFLNSFRSKPAPADQAFVQLDIYGRGNNAYRWAGETDVFEAIDAFLSAERRAFGKNLIDPRRVVLRGFSMGGAGTWHLGLHHPSRWAVIGPGAGFSTTRGYTRLPEPLPEYVEKCLHIYDAVDYAENAVTVPVVAYGGADDPQLQAARNVEARLAPLSIPMTLLVAPNTGHQLTPEYARKAEAEYLKYAGPGKGRQERPETVKFTTYTLKYNRSDWVALLGLGRHYEPARVEARTANGGAEFDVKTANVRRLRLSGAASGDVAVTIDGQKLTARPADGAVTLERSGDQWGVPDRGPTRREKLPGLQGPIDDAFSDAFLCVRGGGKPWHPATGRYADAALERFLREWDKHMRGRLVVKDDNALSDDDLRNRHLILFGDPSSNAIIGRIVSSLPLTWTRERVGFGGQTADSATHVPVLIHPNPLVFPATAGGGGGKGRPPRSPGNYVVINTGHTFHADAFRGTNALLYPRLGDFGLLQLAPTDVDPLATRVVTAGLFDEFWRLAK